MTSPRPGWSPGEGWWLRELATDPAYEQELTPWLLRLLQPRRQHVYLDVGCGEGRVMRSLAADGSSAIGVDADAGLIALAHGNGRVARWALPSLKLFKDSSFNGAAICLVLEHLEDDGRLFDELARVVEKGGSLALIVNHPLFTAPESAPIQDRDGEVLWRPGEYFGSGFTDEVAGEASVRFHHRTTGDLLTAAATSGWSLERLEERGPLASQLTNMRTLADQMHIPRLLGARWIRR